LIIKIVFPEKRTVMSYECQSDTAFRQTAWDRRSTFHWCRKMIHTSDNISTVTLWLSTPVNQTRDSAISGQMVSTIQSTIYNKCQNYI